MKLRKFFYSFLLLFFVGTTSYCQVANEKSDLQQLIIESYLTPVYKKGDVEAIRKGFHEDFLMYVLYEGKFYSRSRQQWIEDIEKTRKLGLFKDHYSWEFNFIDIEGQTAVAKFTIQEEGKKKYVDYLTLYKFADGWKVITKQFSMF